MYDLGPDLQTEIPPGTNLLLAGPPMTGKYSLGLDALATGTAAGDGVILVTTKDAGDHVLEQYAGRISLDDRPVAVVDCVSHQQETEEVDDDRISYVSSPVDLTGVGIEVSEYLRAFSDDRGVERNRLMLYSLSTLLMYSDLQTVFRFLHVFTGRIQSVDGLGLFSIDTESHDDRTLNTLKQLFDGVVTTAEDSEPTVRLISE